MKDEFNPYHRWLGIPLEEQPADHYRLLGLKRFEPDPDTIEHAADRQMAHLRRLNLGPRAAMAEQLLSELATARICLLDPVQKEQYDAALRGRQASPATRLPVARRLEPAAQQTETPPAVSFPSQQTSAARRSGGPRATTLAIGAGVGLLAIAMLVAAVAFLRPRPAPDTVAQGSPPAVSPNSASEKVAATEPAPGETQSPTPAPPQLPADTTGAEVAAPAKAAVTVEPPAPVDPLVSQPQTKAEPAAAPANAASAAPGEPEPSSQPAPPPKSESDSRLAIPSDAAQRDGEMKVRDVFAEQFKAGTPAALVALSRELEAQGLDEKNTPDVRYAAFRLAESVAAESGDVSRALALVAARGQHFEVDVPAEKAALISRLSEKATAAQRGNLLAAARREFDALREADSYEAALVMGRLALDLAKAARDRDAVADITQQGIAVRRRYDLSIAAQTALERLKTAPDDGPAHLAAGRWLWFVRAELTEGLKHLAAGSDAALSAAASADLAQPMAAEERLALADKWRKLGDEAEAEGRQRILERAEHWYRQAASGLGGLDKIRAEKQLADLKKELRPPAPPPTTPAAATTAAAASTGKTERPATEWKPPGKNSQANFRTFLGVYMYYLDRNKMYPVVNLQVPARNLWTQEVQDKARGLASFDEISYVGMTNIAIPADGVYVLAAPNCKVLINGADTGGSGDVKIRKGIHTLTFEVHSHGQPYMREASISLRNKDTGEEVPFFNSWQAIQRFLNTPIKGQRVLEVSEWQPTEQNEVRIDPKTLKPIAPGQ